MPKSESERAKANILAIPQIRVFSPESLQFANALNHVFVNYVQVFILTANQILQVILMFCQYRIVSGAFLLFFFGSLNWVAG